MLTALDSEADAVQGLEAGADDYVTKPFGLAELRSRIRAVLRRAQGRVVEGNLRVGPVMLDRDLRRVTMEDTPVRLTFSEFELLGCLMSRPGYAFNRQELLRAIWGDSAYRDPRAIDVHIRHLREKLEPTPGRAEPDPDRPRPGLPLPRGMIRTALRGLRGRLLLSFVATSAVTLVVAAAITLGPLQSRLRDESTASLIGATEDMRGEMTGAVRQDGAQGRATSSTRTTQAKEHDRLLEPLEQGLEPAATSCATAPAARACSSPTPASPIATARRPRSCSTATRSRTTRARCASPSRHGSTTRR